MLGEKALKRTPNFSCMVCGTPIYRSPGTVKSMLFIACSRECAGTWRKLNPGVVSNKTLSNERPNCACIICDEPMFLKPHRLKRGRYVACDEHKAQASGLLRKGLPPEAKPFEESAPVTVFPVKRLNAYSRRFWRNPFAHILAANHCEENQPRPRHAS